MPNIALLLGIKIAPMIAICELVVSNILASYPFSTWVCVDVTCMGHIA